MQVQELEIIITQDGKISMEVRGVPGRQCLELTKDLEADLGDSIIERIETSEMADFADEVRTDNKVRTRS